MMLVRCIVRTIEGFEAGNCHVVVAVVKCGVVTSNEWFLWVFEVANITLFVLALAIFTPGKYLPTDHKRYLDPVDGVTERMGPGFSNADKRPFLVTVLDPFNLAGIVAGKGMKVDKFWERDNPVADGSFAARKSKPQKDDIELLRSN
jgi:hypothetical protein